MKWEKLLAKGTNKTPPPMPAKTPKIPIKNVVKNNVTGQPHQGIVKTSSVAENIKVGVNIE